MTQERRGAGLTILPKRVGGTWQQIADDGALYAPERDLAWNFVPLAREAVAGLRPECWEPWFGDYARAQGVTPEQIGEAARAFGAALRLLADASAEEPADALAASGFLQTPAPAQLLLCARLGQVMVGAFAVAARDVLIQQRVSATLQQQLDRLAQTAGEIATCLSTGLNPVASDSAAPGSAA